MSNQNSHHKSAFVGHLSACHLLGPTAGLAGGAAGPDVAGEVVVVDE